MALSLQWRLAIHGKLDEYDKSLAIAHSTAIRKVTFNFKTQARHAIARGGLGVRLPNALRSVVLDSSGNDISKKGYDADPQGIVYSQATVRRQSGPVDLIGVFQTGAIVLPHKGTYLAVATKEGGGRRAPSMASYPPNTFRIVKPKAGRVAANSNRPVLYAIHRVRKEIWYLLFREVRLRRRYNLDLIYKLNAQSIPTLINAAWEKEEKRLEALV